MGDHVHRDALRDLGIVTEKTGKRQVLENISKEQPGLAGQCSETRKKNQFWIQLTELNYSSQQGFLENQSS